MRVIAFTFIVQELCMFCLSANMNLITQIFLCTLKCSTMTSVN